MIQEVRQAANARITRPLTGMSTRPDDLVLVKKVNSTIHRSRNRDKLDHEPLTGPWKVGSVLQRCLSVEVEMEGRLKPTQRVSTNPIKHLHVKAPDLRHLLAEELIATTPLYTQVDRRRFRSDSAVRAWECRGRS